MKCFVDVFIPLIYPTTHSFIRCYLMKKKGKNMMKKAYFNDSLWGGGESSLCVEPVLTCLGALVPP